MPEPLDFLVLHLNARGCSGKAVRLVELQPHQIDEILQVASSLAGVDATPIQYVRAEQRQGVTRMVKQVTAAPVASAEESNAAAWVAFDPDKPQLNAKDWNVLMSFYAREYNPSEKEIDAIAGKAVRQAAG